MALPLSVPYAPPFFVGHFLSLFKVLFTITSCFALSYVYTFFPLLVLNDCPSVKYAAGYFFYSVRPCLLACPVLPNQSLHALFRLSSFLSRVAVSPGLDTLPSTT